MHVGVSIWPLFLRVSNWILKLFRQCDMFSFFLLWSTICVRNLQFFYSTVHVHFLFLATNEKFDGVAVNNEAYSHIKCHSGVVEQRKYLQNLNMIKTEAMKQLYGHLLTHFSVGYHWGHCGGTPKMITYNGKSQEATRHMIDIFDSVDVQVR